MQLKIEHLTILSLTGLYAHSTEERKNVFLLQAFKHVGEDEHFKQLVDEGYLELTTIDIKKDKLRCPRLTYKGVKLVDELLIQTMED